MILRFKHAEVSDDGDSALQCGDFASFDLIEAPLGDFDDEVAVACEADYWPAKTFVVKVDDASIAMMLAAV